MAEGVAREEAVGGEAPVAREEAVAEGTAGKEAVAKWAAGEEALA